MKKNSIKEMPVYYIIPLLLIAAIVPLIVYLKIAPIDSVSYNYWTGSDKNYDFFSYYKSICIIVFSVASLLLFCYARYRKVIETKQLTIYYIPIAVYAFTILLSSILSKFPQTAWMGFIDRYEGAYVLLSYLTILFTTINLVNNEKLLKIVTGGIFIAAFGVGMIGIFQFYGMDFYKSSISKYFILPSVARNSALSFTFGQGTIYSSLYNTNYVGSYMAMLLPLAFAIFLYVQKNSYKLLSGAFTCLMFANWLGCRSRSGYIGGLIAFIVLSFLLKKQILKNIKTILPLLVAIVLIFIGMNHSADGDLGVRILASISNIGDYNASSEEQGKAVKNELLNDIVFSDKKISIVYGKETLTMSLDGSQLMFCDTQGKKLGITNDEQGRILLEDVRYSDYKIKFDKTNNLFEVQLAKMTFSLLLQPTGFKIVGERGILLDKLDHPVSVGFEGKEKFASMRGYIWSRSIPLLKNNIIFGGGPDTYVMQFPQHDYVGKLRAFDQLTVIVDKPHNVYLQVGINTGVVSLIAFLFILAVYFLFSFRIYTKNEISGYKGFLGIGLFASVTGYVFAGLSNDSLVSVAPIFWLILGMGISCNLQLLIKADDQVIKVRNDKMKIQPSKSKK